jgi:3-mercaptopyruvate sulfurtransferase SseA
LSGEKVTDFEDVQRILEEKSKPVIDVRNPNEFSKGRIPGAHNLPCEFDIFDVLNKIPVFLTFQPFFC